MGKSVLSRVLAQYFIDHQLPFAGADADTSHGALLRYYSDYTQAVDLEQFESSDQIMDRALGAERDVLVDLPAQSARLLKRWLESGDVVDFAREMGVGLTFWHVTDGGYDSVRELESVLSAFEGSLSFVVAKNYGRSPDFSQFDESRAIDALAARGGRVVSLPALDPATMYKIDRNGASFWAAIHSIDPDLVLRPMERQRVKLWLTEAYKGIASVIGPERRFASEESHD